MRSEHAAAEQRADEAEASAARQRASPTERGPLLASSVRPPVRAAAGPTAARTWSAPARTTAASAAKASATSSSSRRPGESPGGVSPPGARRTRREPLGSPGSHRPAIGAHPQRQCANRPGWRLATSAMNLRARLWWRRSRLYFRMAHLTSASLKWRKTGYNMELVEASVVVDPALELKVEHPRQVREGLVRAASDAPAAHLAPHPRLRLTRDRRREVQEVLPEPVLRQPRAERVSAGNRTTSCSCEPRRSASLQYTMRVFCSLSSRPHSASRVAIAARSCGPAARFERGR